MLLLLNDLISLLLLQRICLHLKITKRRCFNSEGSTPKFSFSKHIKCFLSSSAFIEIKKTKKHHWKMKSTERFKATLCFSPFIILGYPHLSYVQSRTYDSNSWTGWDCQTVCLLDSQARSHELQHCTYPSPTSTCWGNDRRNGGRRRRRRRRREAHFLFLHSVAVSPHVSQWPEGFLQKGKQQRKLAEQGKWGSLWGKMYNNSWG